MPRLLLLLVVLLLPTPSLGVQLKARSGSLATAQNTTGGSANEFDSEYNNTVYWSVTICYHLDAGASATVQTEYRQRSSPYWAGVKSSAVDLTPSYPYECIGIINPQGIYRTNVIALSADGFVSTTFELGPKVAQP